MPQPLTERRVRLGKRPLIDPSESMNAWADGLCCHYLGDNYVFPAIERGISP
jgi:hypothetical protein